MDKPYFMLIGLSFLKIFCEYPLKDILHAAIASKYLAYVWSQNGIEIYFIVLGLK